MKVAELTLIADKLCPTSRTYCTYLAHAGFIFEKIILVDFIGESRKFSLLQKFVGNRIAFWATQKKKNWPNYEYLEKFFQKVQENVEIQIDYQKDFDFKDYALIIDNFPAKNYCDKNFQKYLLKQKSRTFLYTNGGIVPPSLLTKHNDIRFLHLHPGIVPQIRGSDGLLWSLVMRGKPGVSCFYMNEGIDTGELIGQKEFPFEGFKIPPPTNFKEEQFFYNSLLIAFDPHLRASLLRDIIVKAEGKNIGSLETFKTNNISNESFLWMHPIIRMQIFKSICLK